MANPFRNSYKASVRINAEKEYVWDILTDLGLYELWNPFTPKIETVWKLHEKVILTVQMKKDRKPIRQVEYLLRFDPPLELAWGMNWGFLLKAERIQRLRTDRDGYTEYFTEDIIAGLLSPIVHLIYGRSIQNGFEILAKGLKRFAENG
ncbi:MAG: SRPBCC domain-containing protein [Cytophagales bacterium]|nr:SRPBCC domain-containing protein [Cytophagales bacterium]